MEKNKSCACGSAECALSEAPVSIERESSGNADRWIAGFYEYAEKRIPAVKTELDLYDFLGTLKVRLALGRMAYAVAPGLYCVGTPGSDSPVLATSNYKLTFDTLRKELAGVSAWILVLDTGGINVWCAAGKGTFGTEELIRKINSTELSKVVGHRRIILPQLGAVGVAAHMVKEATGFSVNYGPVRASDVKKYIEAGFKKDDTMSRVTFNMRDRLTVIPVEIVMAWRFIAGIAAFFFFINAGAGKLFWKKTMRDLVPALGGVFSGVAVTPALLPYIPGRAFSLKGLISGFVWLVICGLKYGFTWREWLVNFLTIAPLSSFFALNFTGATTFTSQSGAEYEVKKTFSLMKYSIVAAIILKILSKFEK